MALSQTSEPLGGLASRYGEAASPADRSIPSVAAVTTAISRAGLVFRGATRLEAGERRGPLVVFDTVVLVGMAGRKGWDAFASSPESRDGLPHPLDRWSRRVVGSLARDLGAQPLFPFDGPPHWPFQQWARRAETLHASPLGLLIHPEYGLWHSYRGALGFADALPFAAPKATASPCESCAERPCLGACPVAAFTPGHYNVDGCVAHLKGGDAAGCLDGGCAARRACPVGRAHAHGPAQARFTMQAFVRARGGLVA